MVETGDGDDFHHLLRGPVLGQFSPKRVGDVGCVVQFVRGANKESVAFVPDRIDSVAGGAVDLRLREPEPPR